MSVLSVEVGNVVTRRRPIRKEMQLPVLLLLITFRPEFEAPSASGALQDVKFSTDSAGLLAAWNSQMSSSSEELARWAVTSRSASSIAFPVCRLGRMKDVAARIEGGFVGKRLKIVEESQAAWRREADSSEAPRGPR